MGERPLLFHDRKGCLKIALKSRKTERRRAIYIFILSSQSYFDLATADIKFGSDHMADK